MRRFTIRFALIVLLVPVAAYLILLLIGDGLGQKEPLPGPFGDNARPILFAHRGAVGTYPENTLGAIIEAERLGFKAVEIDVQFHGDGEFIVFHDQRTERQLGIPGVASGRSIEELQQHPIILENEPSAEVIPTLTAAIDTAGAGLLFYIDTKHYGDVSDRRLAEAMSDFIRTHDLYSRAVVASSHFGYIVSLEFADPRIVTCFEGIKPELAWLLKFLPRRFKSDLIASRWSSVTPELIDWLGESGLKRRYLTFHVDELTMMTALVQGVELMIVDYAPYLDRFLNGAATDDSLDTADN